MTRGSTTRDEGEERRRAALRANLARRKEQARARAVAVQDPPDPDDRPEE